MLKTCAEFKTEGSFSNMVLKACVNVVLKMKTEYFGDWLMLCCVKDQTKQKIWWLINVVLKIKTEDFGDWLMLR